MERMSMHIEKHEDGREYFLVDKAEGLSVPISYIRIWREVEKIECGTEVGPVSPFLDIAKAWTRKESHVQD